MSRGMDRLPAEDATSLRVPVSSRVRAAAIFVGFAFVAGVLQILATVKLGLAPIERLEAAAGEGVGWYLLSIFIGVLALASFWVFRRTPTIATAVFTVIAIALILWAPRQTSSLGFAYHGEYVVHHFAALICAAANGMIAMEWGRRSTLGPGRWVAVVLISVGTALLLFAHVSEIDDGLGRLVLSWIRNAGGACVILALVASLGLFWTQLEPPSLRIVAVVLQVPLLLRTFLAWPDGLVGGPIPPSGRTILAASILLAAAATFVGFRPRTPNLVKAVVVVLGALGTVGLYSIYRRSFGTLEQGIGALTQSLFAFPLPYPEHVEVWRMVAVAVAMFLMFATVYGGLLSGDERVRGLALGLMLTAGLGLSNPQLVLMTVAAHLLWIETLLVDPQTTTAPAGPVANVLAVVAESLGMPPPVVLEASDGSMVALRGDYRGTALDLRARPSRVGGWSVVLRTGVCGRGRPEAELTPHRGQGGHLPEHPIQASHRIVGSARVLESLGDPPLDALGSFSDAHARFWASGAEVQLGRDLSQLNPEALTRLIRAFAHLGV